MPSYDEQLEAAYQLAEQRLGRALTKAERTIDVIALDRALERGKERLQAAIDAEHKRAVRLYLQHRIRVRLEITQAMISALYDLYLTGQQSAARELKLLGLDMMAFAEIPPEVERLAEQLAPFLTYIGAKSEDRILSAELKRDPKKAELMKEALKVLGARDAAGRFTSTALAKGRSAKYEENQHLFGGWQYSAIMDKGTCDECAARDGEIYDTLEAAYAVLPNFGPNPKCYGDGRCRCTLVPVVA